MPPATPPAQPVARLRVIGSAKEHDRRRLEQLCAGLREGEIVLFDKGYYVFDYFWALTQRAVFFVADFSVLMNRR